MIVAIEGPSAAGKTTWCRSHFPYTCVAGGGGESAAPDLFGDPAEVGQFWVNHAVQTGNGRWRLKASTASPSAMEIPFISTTPGRCGSRERWPKPCSKLSRSFIGTRSKRSRSDLSTTFCGWKCRSTSYAAAPEPITTRRRKRHEMYLALVPWMKAWFQERERILPGTVREMTEGLDVRALDNGSSSWRYDTEVMDGMLERLGQR